MDLPLKNEPDLDISDSVCVKLTTSPSAGEQGNHNAESDSFDNKPLVMKTELRSSDTSSEEVWSPSADFAEGVPQTAFKKRRRCKKTAKQRDLERTRTASLETYKLELEKESHLSRLNNLLSANGLERVEVPPDGNCFFESCSKHLDSVNSSDLRSCLCNYLEEQFSTFIHFLEDSSDENERYLRYFHNVTHLRCPGMWSNDAADLLPLALANWTGRTVKIFSSDPNRPVIEILPLVVDRERTDSAVISLSFLALQNAPHYDACVPVDRRRESASCSSAANPPSQAVDGLSKEDGLQGNTNGTRTDPSQQSLSLYQISDMSSEVKDQSRNDDTSDCACPDSPVAVPPQNMHFLITEACTSQSRNTFAPSDTLELDLSPGPGCHAAKESPECSCIPGPVEDFEFRNDLKAPRKPPESYDPRTSSCSPKPNSPCTATDGVQTPRKQGTFPTSPTKKLTRKRESRPETWKKNVRKTLRLAGKAYTSHRGKLVPSKTLKPIDCSQCSHKCSRISQEQRQDLFDSFYSLNSYDRQKSFVCSHVQEKKTRRYLNDNGTPCENRRKVNRAYFFTLEGKKERVCKNFFISTLSIGSGYIDHAMIHSKHGEFDGKNGRGKHTPHNKTSDKVNEAVRQHIESFPEVESHYTRKDRKRKYLSSDLNVQKMYELYKEQCLKENTQPVSANLYRQIFNKKYKLSFHSPQKDQCATCSAVSIKKKQNTLSKDDETSLEEHLSRIETSKQQKAADKEAARKDPSLHVITTDTQAVLQSPHGLESQMYYKRKLCVYTFTVYSLADGRATCYTWNETEGKRGSCEIASCLYKYISSLPAHVQHVIIYSDFGGGQNRNQYLAAALLFAVNTLPHVKTITQKFLESGHTQVECNPMHSAISSARKNTPIYVPSEWDIVFRLARRHNAYYVVPIKHESFYNFKKLASACIQDARTDRSGHRVNWRQIRFIQVYKGVDDSMSFKYNLDDDCLKALQLVGRPELPKLLSRLYDGKLPVSEAKKQDLLSLCVSGVIPVNYHSFYEGLSTSPSASDRLPKPDAKDTESDTE